MIIQPIPQRGEPALEPTGDFNLPWWMFFKSLSLAFSVGFTGTIVTAKLTTGGANGSMTFKNGILISQVAAT